MAMQHFMQVDDLMGCTVVNERGETLGRMETIVLEPETGRAVYVVLSGSGCLGVGEKLFAIPWSVFRFTDGESLPILDVPLDLLEHAPAFAPSEWPDFCDPGLASHIAAHYGTAVFDIVAGGALGGRRAL